MRKREVRHLNSEMIKCACGCSELIHSINWMGEPAKFKIHHNVRIADKTPHWKGGRMINSQGYVLIHSPEHPFHNKKGYVREHRLVMEKYLGRYLNPLEQVHHNNGNKQDNRIENLLLLSDNSSHLKLHYKNRKLDSTNRFL